MYLWIQSGVVSHYRAQKNKNNLILQQDYRAILYLGEPCFAFSTLILSGLSREVSSTHVGTVINLPNDTCRSANDTCSHFVLSVAKVQGISSRIRVCSGNLLISKSAQ